MSKASQRKQSHFNDGYQRGLKGEQWSYKGGPKTHHQKLFVRGNKKGYQEYLKKMEEVKVVGVEDV